MPLSRRSLLLSAIPLCLALSSSWAQDAASQWNGTWIGKIGRIASSDVAVTVTDGKVTSYTIRGAPFAIKFSKVTAEMVSFGDGKNYYFRIKKGVDSATAVGTVRGRMGAGTVSLTKRSA